MLELYHAPISTCSQKVRTVLAEKGLTWTGHTLDLMAGDQHDADYQKLNPNAVVPTLVDDGRVLIESTLINEYLDDAFAEPPLKPADAAGRYAMRQWTKRVDEGVHAACGVLTYAIGARPMLLRRPPEEVRALIDRIPNEARRAARRSVVEHGVKAPEMAGAVRTYLSLLDAMEAALAQDPWLAGEQFSLAEACVLPYLVRLDHLAMGVLISERRRPGVAKWYARVTARPSFGRAVAAFAPDPVVSAMHRAGEAAWPEVEPLTS